MNIVVLRCIPYPVNFEVHPCLSIDRIQVSIDWIQVCSRGYVWFILYTFIVEPPFMNNFEISLNTTERESPSKTRYELLRTIHQGRKIVAKVVIVVKEEKEGFFFIKSWK